MVIATAESVLRPLHEEPDDQLQPPTNPRSGLVLVIEDDKPVREMFRRSLLFAGFEVLVAAGGREGWQLLKDDPRIAVVLLDLHMPYMDGRAVRAAQLACDRFAASLPSSSPAFGLHRPIATSSRHRTTSRSR